MSYTQENSHLLLRQKTLQRLQVALDKLVMENAEDLQKIHGRKSGLNCWKPQ